MDGKEEQPRTALFADFLFNLSSSLQHYYPDNLRVNRLSNGEKITIEAWPSRKEIAAYTELLKPCFHYRIAIWPRTTLVYIDNNK